MFLLRGSSAEPHSHSRCLILKFLLLLELSFLLCSPTGPKGQAQGLYKVAFISPVPWGWL